MPRPNLQRYDLDQRALRHIRSTLDAGNLLSGAVQNLLSQTPGETYTLAPTGTPLEQLYEFTVGGLQPENVERSQPEYLAAHGNLVPVETMAEAQGEIIHAALQEQPGGICLVDDVMPRWSELSDPGPGAFNIGEEVYHAATCANSIDEIVDVLCLTDALWHGLAVVCAENLQRPAIKQGLDRCVQSATLLTCTAYDREGFVVWQRKVEQ